MALSINGAFPKMLGIRTLLYRVECWDLGYQNNEKKLKSIGVANVDCEFKRKDKIRMSMYEEIYN